MKRGDAYKTRFPHTCRVYGVTGETPFEDGDTRIFYEGECCVYGNSSPRTFKTDGVIRGEYAVDIPKLVRGVRSGDLLDVTDYNGTFTACVITDSMPVVYGSREGTTVYFNTLKN